MWLRFARLTFYAETAGTMSYRLLEADEPPPVVEYRRGGRSPFVIAVDHAGRRIPRRLCNLGLPLSELERHTAWDLGALAVAMRVSAALDAPLIAQEHSRLVIDCNRTPGSETSSRCWILDRFTKERFSIYSGGEAIQIRSYRRCGKPSLLPPCHWAHPSK